MSCTHRHVHLFEFTHKHTHTHPDPGTYTLLHTQIPCTYIYQVSLCTYIPTVPFVLMYMDNYSLVKAPTHEFPPPPPPLPRLLLSHSFVSFPSSSHSAIQCTDYVYPHPAEADSDVPHPLHQCGLCFPTKRLRESGALPQGPEPAQSRQVGYQPAVIIHATGTKWGRKSC